MRRSYGRLRPTRRGLVGAAAGLAAAAGSGLGVGHVAEALGAGKNSTGSEHGGKSPFEPFWGRHQSGITTPAQRHTYFAALDLVTARREDLITVLRRWTEAAARMAAGQPAQPLGQDLTVAAPDTAEALGLPPARLTLTFGSARGCSSRTGKTAVV